MAMEEEETHSWTLGGLIGAFIDLFLAYFLLCGSAMAFFASKFLSFFGFYLPCPCKGNNSERENSDLCIHRLLFQWPSRKIGSIQVMAAKRFPYELVRNDNNSRVAEKPRENGNSHRFVELLEDEASCSSCSLPRLLPMVDEENAYDAKGKRTVILKRRHRRRRRASSYDSAKLPSVFPSDNEESDDWRRVRGKSSEIVNHALGKEVSLLGFGDAQTGHDLDVKTCHSYDCNGSVVDSTGQDKYSSCYENCTSNVQDSVQTLGNGDDCIRKLENALAEEKAAYAALYLELEKERAAAASAADEAMAMISRLQEEKATLEWEMRQYQMMIEERVVYDEEEMNILQEILIRRERENHFLEKELEAYRQTGLGGSEPANGKPRVLPDEWEQGLHSSHEAHEYPPRTENPLLAKKDGLSLVSSNYMVAQTCVSTEAGEEPVEIMEHEGQAQDNVHSSFCNTEPDVLDVHVIGDNIELREEKNEKLSSTSFCTVSNEQRNNSLELGSLPVQNGNAVSSCPRASKMESDTSVDGPSSRLGTTDSRCKTPPFAFGRDSSRSGNDVKFKIDTAIEILSERLMMMKHEREKLSLSAEKREQEKGQLKLLEDIANNLLQTKQLRNSVRGASLPRPSRNPVRGASLPLLSRNLVRGSSLPPPSDKESLRDRRSQSACESS